MREKLARNYWWLLIWLGVIAYDLARGDWVTPLYLIGGFLAGLLVGFPLIYLYDRRWRRKNNFPERDFWGRLKGKNGTP